MDNSWMGALLAVFLVLVWTVLDLIRRQLVRIGNALIDICGVLQGIGGAISKQE